MGDIPTTLDSSGDECLSPVGIPRTIVLSTNTEHEGYNVALNNTSTDSRKPPKRARDGVGADSMATKRITRSQSRGSTESELNQPGSVLRDVPTIISFSELVLNHSFVQNPTANHASSSENSCERHRSSRASTERKKRQGLLAGEENLSITLSTYNAPIPVTVTDMNSPSPTEAIPRNLWNRPVLKTAADSKTLHLLDPLLNGLSTCEDEPVGAATLVKDSAKPADFTPVLPTEEGFKAVVRRAVNPTGIKMSSAAWTAKFLLFMLENHETHVFWIDERKRIFKITDESLKKRQVIEWWSAGGYTASWDNLTSKIRYNRTRKTEMLYFQRLEPSCPVRNRNRVFQFHPAAYRKLKE